MIPSPSFSGFEPDGEETLAAEWMEVWDDPESHAHFLAERDGRIVGHILLWRRPPTSAFRWARSISPTRRPAFAERGTGVGLALTHHVLGWAHEHGCPVMTTDWRMTNLLASRFWPRRGFRASFLRLYRWIP